MLNRRVLVGRQNEIGRFGHRWAMLLALGVALLVVGCAPQENTAPTLTEAATLPPTDVSPIPPTLPPSWTPGKPPTVTPQAINRESATLAPLATIEGAATLAPSWTPFRAPTVTRPARTVMPSRTPPLPTVTPAISPTRLLTEGPAPVVTSQVFDPACDGFKSFLRLESFIGPGRSPSIGWFVVPGADSYLLYLTNPEGRYTFRTSIIAPPGESVVYYGFAGDLFTVLGTYGWDLHPVKDNGRMCPSITGQIYVNPRY